MALYDSIFVYLHKRSVRGKDRLYASLQKIGFKKLLTVNCKFNIRMYLNPYEYVDSVTIKEGFYESEITDHLFLKLDKDNSVFWDVGANIGLHSLAVKKNRPNTKVISFEPNPKTLGQLHDNVKLNKLDIEVCGFALFDSIGITTLYIADGNSGMTTLTPWDEKQYLSKIKCQTLTGNYLVEQGFEIPNVIKIDTEGSELEVLKGFSDFLGNAAVRTVIFESGNGLTELNAENDIVNYLKGFGLDKLIQLERKENTQHNLSNYAQSKS